MYSILKIISLRKIISCDMSKVVISTRLLVTGGSLVTKVVISRGLLGISGCVVSKVVTEAYLKF